MSEPSMGCLSRKQVHFATWLTLALPCLGRRVRVRLSASNTFSPCSSHRVTGKISEARDVMVLGKAGLKFEKEYPQVVDATSMLEDSDFPIPPEELITKAKNFFNMSAQDWNDGMFSEDFEFRGPVVGPLDRQELVEANTQFGFDEAFPDNNFRYYNFRNDPFEPNRVWVDSRQIGTHTGAFATPAIPPTGMTVESPPQTLSLTFNDRGQIIKFTNGYVIDRLQGNTGGVGGIFGVLYAIGRPLPFREAKPYKPSFAYRLLDWLTGLEKQRRRRRAMREAEKQSLDST